MVPSQDLFRMSKENHGKPIKMCGHLIRTHGFPNAKPLTELYGRSAYCFSQLSVLEEHRK